MSRSSWKISPIDYQLLDRVANNHFFSEKFSTEKPTEKKILNSHAPTFKVERSCIIGSDIIGAKVIVHNGRNVRVFKVRKEYVGLKYGEFSYTRVLVKHKLTVAKKSPTKK